MINILINLKTIIVFIILFIAFGGLLQLPLNWYSAGGGGMLPSGTLYDSVGYFKPVNLILNLVVWYIVSVLLLIVYYKVKKK